LFETARRLILTGFLVLLMPGSASQLAVALIVTAASIAVSCRCKPFAAVGDERLHLAAQVCTVAA
jgi:hypothetical protein